MKAADSKIRHFCGRWQGPRSPPPTALEHRVSTSRPGLLGAVIPPPPPASAGLDRLPGASLGHLDRLGQQAL